MYTTGPGARTREGLRIGGVRRRLFDGAARFAGDPGHRAELDTYTADLLRPYGLALAGGAGGPGHSYGEMAEALIRELVPADAPVDLIVLAFAVPDVRPGRATATYLSHVCPGNPLAFAVCDQGSAAAFTGLRLAREYRRTGGCERALLLVVEQAGLPYEPATPAPVPARHAAVALLLDGAGPPVEVLRQHPNVAPDEVRARLSAELADLTTTATTVVLGTELAGHPGGGGKVLVAPAGQPHTGVWWELAGLDGGAGPVVLADYDRALGHLCLLATGAA
ncbi:MAG: hypothetical protein V7603_4411 [Micromonosporaceae bacterium]